MAGEGHASAASDGSVGVIAQVVTDRGGFSWWPVLGAGCAAASAAAVGAGLHALQARGVIIVAEWAAPAVAAAHALSIALEAAAGVVALLALVVAASALRLVGQVEIVHTPFGMRARLADAERDVARLQAANADLAQLAEKRRVVLARLRRTQDGYFALNQEAQDVRDALDAALDEGR